MAIPLTGAAYNVAHSVALSWLVEQETPGLDIMEHAQRLEALLSRRGEKLDKENADPMAQEIASLGQAVSHIRRGRERMRFVGLL